MTRERANVSIALSAACEPVQDNEVSNWEGTANLTIDLTQYCEGSMTDRHKSVSFKGL